MMMALMQALEELAHVTMMENEGDNLALVIIFTIFVNDAHLYDLPMSQGPS